MWLPLVVLSIIIGISILLVGSGAQNVVVKRPVQQAITSSADKNCIPATLDGYLQLPEDISAQHIDKIYKGDKESDLHFTKPIANYVYNASYEMATGYSEKIPKFVFSSPIQCTDDQLACSDQNRQCLTDVGQLDNVDSNLIYQRVTKETTTHKPGYTRDRIAASYL